MQYERIVWELEDKLASAKMQPHNLIISIFLTWSCMIKQFKGKFEVFLDGDNGDWKKENSKLIWVPLGEKKKNEVSLKNTWHHSREWH